MAPNFTKGDRLLAGMKGGKPASSPYASRSPSPSPSLSPASRGEPMDVVALEDMMTRNKAEIAEVRDALLDMGLPQECVDTPETMDIEHLEPGERDRFNDALREYRTLERDMERDLHEIRAAEGRL